MSLITVDRSLITSEIDCNDSTDGDKYECSSRSSRSEDFMMCKGTAVGLNIHSRRKSSFITSDDEIQDHLKRIIAILRFGDFVQLIVKLQSANPKPHQHRYCCIISTNGKLDTEESSLLGVDITNGQATVGLVLPIWQDMSINLCGDGGFEVITKDTVKQFKPVSVQALWATFQAINKACQVARTNDYFSRGFTHDWVNYYHSLPASSTHQIQEWLKTDESDVFIHSLFHYPLSDDPTEREMEALIRVKLQEIMYTVDLEEVTVLQLRERLEEELKQPLHAFRHFIEKQILTIYGQMDEASLIFDHVLLGTSFNASNRDELDRRNVTHILNVTREVDNFFPCDKFEYKNIRVYDDEQSTLLPYWEETHRFINEARNLGTRCLVHCKMGISRSASTVIAYAMKENNWDLETALSYVRDRRSCVQPNPGFLRELYTYQGILEASSNRHKPIFHNDEVKTTKPLFRGNNLGNNQQCIHKSNNNSTSSFSIINPPEDHHQSVLSPMEHKSLTSILHPTSLPEVDKIFHLHL
ncbi:Protein phosphatase Slingshot like [Schistosoma japonicum]|nr:Protein phosphatase Slingshot like [Schistosoma japonicum]KAH8875968.1 Protein phosphatase Slingshot like [Schistosoma japonicum]KAH8875969.1 Protein phosphatase Slingshot like [Schistosoma japonicum]